MILVFAKPQMVWFPFEMAFTAKELFACGPRSSGQLRQPSSSQRNSRAHAERGNAHVLSEIAALPR